MSKDEYIATNLACGNIFVDHDTGNVYASRGPGGMRLECPKLLTGSELNGYKVVSIRNGGYKAQCRVHRIIWISAFGVPAEGLVIDHINNNKQDNRLANLQLLTPEENSSKAKTDGLYLSGEDNPSTKITRETADEIRIDYSSGEKTMRELASRYGISKSRVHQIINRSGWTDIPGASDSARYKALGNSLAIPTAEFVIAGIAEA